MALRFDGTPYGFFAKHQVQPVPKNATSSTIAEMVVDRIASKALPSFSVASPVPP
jgi:hypothetical protein